MTDVPKGKYIGKRVGPLPADEAEHFFKCEQCGGWVDMRDLGDVFAHEQPHTEPPERVN